MFSNQILKYALKLTLLIMMFSGAASAQTKAPLDLTPKIALPGLKDFSNDSGESARTVTLRAVLVDGGESVENGLIWRVFDPTPDETGKLRLIAETEGGSTKLDFTPGEYFVHVAFGRAGVTKKLSVPSTGSISAQTYILDAGGLILNATSGGNGRVVGKFLKFAIYSGEDQDAQDSDRQLVLEGVSANTVIRLNEGIYHVVSNYGDINAVTRADIRVEKGKLTEVQMQHRAALVTFKLVSKQGGEGIADTAWSLYSSSGDVINEMVGAFPNLVLAEGDYQVSALHRGKEYPLDFHVTAGENVDIEVLLGN
ncbi:hypothetical protein [Lentilitoribacter sp. EG35]|uniref:hypothetical protein n=1 Tax=Lentilitoribacter sp. EG35 TaxID=3234192 RepID=UPI003460DFC1